MGLGGRSTTSNGFVGGGWWVHCPSCVCVSPTHVTCLHCVENGCLVLDILALSWVSSDVGVPLYQVVVADRLVAIITDRHEPDTRCILEGQRLDLLSVSVTAIVWSRVELLTFSLIQGNMSH